MRLIHALLIGALAACGSFRDIGFACTLDYVPGVIINLTDAESTEKIVGATLVLSEDSYAETMKEVEPGQYRGAYERVGTYKLSISAPGYDPDVIDGIVVTGDRCHVVRQVLDVELRLATRPVVESLYLVIEDPDGTVRVEPVEPVEPVELLAEPRADDAMRLVQPPGSRHGLDMIEIAELVQRVEDLCLHTERLELRRFRASDVDTAVEHELDPENMRYIRDPLPRAATIERVRGFLAPWQGGDGEWTGLVLALRGQATMAGVVAFRIESVANETAEIGFRIAPEHRRQGLVFEASNRLLDFLVDEVGVRKVVAYCVADNEASSGLLQKLGMQREGRLRQFSRLGGVWHDELVYGLLPALGERRGH